ncbi:MAG: Rab family GTPase [Candidatus Helarchaeota archaeon]
MAEGLVRYKMVLFGSEGVGKTSLVERFINDKFEEQYISTLGYNVYEKQVNYNKWTISLMIFDIGGQERFRDLRKKYATGANTAFIIYDITNRDSFNEILGWKTDLNEFSGAIPFILIGNKADLVEFRTVSEDEGRKVATDLNALTFFETSAKTGFGVEEAFTQLAIKTFEINIGTH